VPIEGAVLFELAYDMYDVFDLAEKDVDEFCDNFVGEEENWNSVFTFARE